MHPIESVDSQPVDLQPLGLIISDLPNGIYTDLTDCYSPTCTNDNQCYSWSCLRKKVTTNRKKEEQTLNIIIEFKTRPKSVKGTCLIGKQGVKKKLMVLNRKKILDYGHNPYLKIL